MKAFEVSLNGKQTSVAGIASGRGVLTVHVTSVTGHTNQPNIVDLFVKGLDTPANDHITWAKGELQVGDEVSIRIVDSEQVDEPLYTQKGVVRERTLEQKIEYFYKLREELAEHLDE